MAAGDGIEILGPPGDRFEEILTPEALQLVATLQREFAGKRAELLAARAARHQDLSAGGTLDFLPETRRIRDDNLWRVPAPAPGLVDRRVEITGPTERKMTINALNSGANVWLADFEDANTPLWENMITGQVNLRDALDRTIDFTSDEGKDYRLRPDDELARSWSARGAGTWMRSMCWWTGAGVGQPVRLRAVLLPLRPAPARQGRAPTPRPRWRATWRRGCGTTLRRRPGRPGPAARDHPGDRADRDDPGRV
jgi:malate synthase